jgi:hypothetical protein
MSCAGSRGMFGLTLLLGACGSVRMDLPPEFLQLETPRAELKATTPDDARLWVRQFGDRDQGDLAFWAETLKLDLVRNRGYVLSGEEEVQDRNGTRGVQMQFGVTTEGEPHGYLVAVFIHEGGSENTIVVAEFVAPTAVFEKYLDAVQTAMSTIDP